MRIIVLGAGVVGLATAYRLARDGHSVTVLEGEAQPGLATSRANGGQLSYSYVAPFAGAGVIGKIPGWLLDADGPMRFRPDFTRAQALWLLGFLRACNAATSAYTTAALLRLAYLSRDELHALLAREALDFAFARSGKLVVYSDSAGLEGAKRQMATQAALGSEQHALTAAECLTLEPALGHIGARLVGGIHTPSEEAGDCHLFCLGLERVLRRSNFDVTFHFNTRVTQLLTAGGRVVGAATAQGVHEADAFVLALGNGARALATPIGVDLPIQPLKGYSFTLPITGLAPSISITDASAKVVYARLGDSLRVAGMADVVGLDTRFDNRRLDTLLRQAQATFPQASHWRELRPWTGMRPATPTGLPMLGPTARWPNLHLNLGQGSLGFTLAMGSAAIIADLLAGRPAPIIMDGLSA
jgi:D-amino-acid dehydrogenase